MQRAPTIDILGNKFNNLDIEQLLWFYRKRFLDYSLSISFESSSTRNLESSKNFTPPNLNHPFTPFVDSSMFVV
jgi:hypothetical protein